MHIGDAPDDTAPAMQSTALYYTNEVDDELDVDLYDVLEGELSSDLHLDFAHHLDSLPNHHGNA